MPTLREQKRETLDSSFRNTCQLWFEKTCGCLWEDSYEVSNHFRPY